MTFLPTITQHNQELPVYVLYGYELFQILWSSDNLMGPWNIINMCM
jgi:hypothetical protein